MTRKTICFGVRASGMRSHEYHGGAVDRVAVSVCKNKMIAIYPASKPTHTAAPRQYGANGAVRSSGFVRVASKCQFTLATIIVTSSVGLAMPVNLRSDHRIFSVIASALGPPCEKTSMIRCRPKRS